MALLMSTLPLHLAAFCRGGIRLSFEQDRKRKLVNVFEQTHAGALQQAVEHPTHP